MFTTVIHIAFFQTIMASLYQAGLNFSHNFNIIRDEKFNQYKRIYHTLERHILPSVHLDPSYSTRLLLTTWYQDCGSSSLLLHDSRQEIGHQYSLKVAREVYSMSIAGTVFQSQSY